MPKDYQVNVIMVAQKYVLLFFCFVFFFVSFEPRKKANQKLLNKTDFIFSIHFVVVVVVLLQ